MTQSLLFLSRAMAEKATGEEMLEMCSSNKVKAVADSHPKTEAETVTGAVTVTRAVTVTGAVIPSEGN